MADFHYAADHIFSMFTRQMSESLVMFSQCLRGSQTSESVVMLSQCLHGSQMSESKWEQQYCSDQFLDLYDYQQDLNGKTQNELD